MITDAAPVLGTNTATQAQACAFVNARGSYYQPQALQEITSAYWQVAPTIGIDANLAFSQVIHETSERYPTDKDSYKPLSSWWAQRPRRNPAGIGVNGTQQSKAPALADSFRWAYDPQRRMYYRGYSFRSWQQAARIHLGWLLLYCLPAGTGTPDQQALIATTLAFRQVPFPADLRGSVRCLRELGAAHNRTGKGWADPGTNYGAEIAATAQTISEVKV